VQSPFLPALLGDRGLPAGQIGLVLGAATAIRIAAGPAVGHVADRLRLHALLLCGCAAAAALAGLGYISLHGLWPLLLVALAQAALLAPVVPLSDALATTAAHESQTGAGRGFEYGWLRAAGSAAFIIGTVLSGQVVAVAGLSSMPWFSGALLAAGGLIALMLPALPMPSTVFARSGTRAWAALLQIAVYRRLLLVAALIEGSHALHDSFAVIRWRAAGIDLPTISLLWSESVLAEVVVFMAVGPWLVGRLGARGGCALAAVAGAIRWTVMAATTSPAIMACTQPLHGVTFALLHLACMRLIVQVVPIRLAATAQSLYGTASIGLATALLTLASGVLYQRLGGFAFLAMALLCMAALPLCAGLEGEHSETG
jgi:PPP family 3-phenylpropionic acid transporter